MIGECPIPSQDAIVPTSVPGIQSERRPFTVCSRPELHVLVVNSHVTRLDTFCNESRPRGVERRMQTTVERGDHEQAFEFPRLRTGSGGTTQGQNRTRGIRPSGIVGGLGKRGPWWNCEPTAQPKGCGRRLSSYTCARPSSVPTPGWLGSVHLQPKVAKLDLRQCARAFVTRTENGQPQFFIIAYHL